MPAVLLLVGVAIGLTSCRAPVVVEQAAVGEAKEETKFDLPAHEFIHVGMTDSQLESLVGKPSSVQEIGDRPGASEWHYGFGLVAIEHGVVIYKYPPSKAAE